MKNYWKIFHLWKLQLEFKTQVIFLILEFSLKQVEEIIKSRDKVICDLEKANDALKTYSEEVKKLRAMF